MYINSYSTIFWFNNGGGELLKPHINYLFKIFGSMEEQRNHSQDFLNSQEKQEGQE